MASLQVGRGVPAERLHQLGQKSRRRLEGWLLLSVKPSGVGSGAGVMGGVCTSGRGSSVLSPILVPEQRFTTVSPLGTWGFTSLWPKAVLSGVNIGSRCSLGMPRSSRQV